MIMVLEKLKIIKHKTILLRTIGVILLAWACYIPEVKLDLDHAYVKNGVLSTHASRSNTSLRLNGKGFCTSVFMIGCKSGLRNSWELIEILKNKTPVEVVFARDMGNSIEAVFFKRVFAIEVRLNDKPLPYCSQDEMLNNLYYPHWFAYLCSALLFLFVLPLIFNFSFYHSLWNNIWEK